MDPLALVCIGLLLALVVQQWQHHRHRLEWERVMRLERIALLQRIQAPELAVLPDDAEPASYVAPDDDKAYWDALEERDS
jgi:Zn-dependent protease with chaperone function